MSESAVPAALRSSYRDWEWTPVRSWPGRETWRLVHPDGRVAYLKVASAIVYPSIRDEAERTRWAAAYLPVADVLDSGSDGRTDWMVTAALPGRDATAPDLIANPATLVPLLARGLRRFHEAPVAACPFDFRLERSLAHVRQRAVAGDIDAERDFHPEHRRFDVAGALAELERTRPRAEDLVVCHGDYCLPNVLIVDGEASGFIDLGELGVADRWWDLTTAMWSLEWNLGPGWDGLFLDTYGIEGDWERVAFYRLLYDLVS